ncbi:S41 family peptidase [Flocculibacter collagenilyticus]|uniref:S41 family peptidase n=1 Tax=Flocculibacter collagenilyticus TaxID=2744479 RepID=UPI0018F7CFAD|nr:S41 family peptidase [Flocculibacter collagenilyticus]
MKIKTKILVPIILASTLVSYSKSPIANTFDPVAAWEELESVLKQQYAYIDKPDFNVQHMFDEFKHRIKSAKNKKEFADISQMFLRHFHDPHLNLGPYDEKDFSVFPTGSDIRATYQNNRFIVDDIKADSAADLAGIRPGAEVVSIDNLPVKKAVENIFGQAFKQLTVTQINYGVNVSLGGYRNKERIIELKHHGKLQPYHLAASYKSINMTAKGPTITYKKLNDLGYIRFNNSLGNSNTVSAFKEAVTKLSETSALIIDLRNTPSGGNTGVAEPILGHFVNDKAVYQLYQVQEGDVFYKDAKLEKAYVMPTTPHYAKPYVVLAGRWTGSMGEGMIIGFDAIGAETVVGAPMADLLGGIKTVKLNKSDTWIELGFERLYHVNKTYREDFEPHILLSPADRDANGNDPALAVAQQMLNEKLR